MFINIPTDNSSLWGELVYEYSVSEPNDILITVNNESDGVVAGVKKFYSTSSAKINISPLLRHQMMPEAVDSASGFWTPSTGFPRISLSDSDGSTTSTLGFNYSRYDISLPTVLTTMPSSRLLSPGERDTITVVIEPSSRVQLNRFTTSRESGLESGTSLSVAASNGAICYTVDADDYAADYSSLRLVFYVDSEYLASVSYSFNASMPYSNGYRVAWLSSAGSIEHYTFPAITSQSRQSDGSRLKTIRSAYGSAEEIEALSEIVSSPKVWRVDSDGYSRIEVSSTDFAVRRDGTLMVALLDIAEYD